MEIFKLLISPSFSHFDHLRKKKNQQPKQDQLVLENQWRKYAKVIKERKGIAQVELQWLNQKIRKSDSL